MHKRGAALALSILEDEPEPPPADRDALADERIAELESRIAQIWQLAERGATLGHIKEVCGYVLGLNEPPDSGRDALADALIDWAADEDSTTYYDAAGQAHCKLCGATFVWPGDDHDLACLHLRARRLRGDDES